MVIKKVLITQSNYIPWIGYFDAISQVDEFIALDCVQYTRRDWRNRNKIITPQGPTWLTIPVEVKGKYSQKINETIISDPEWNEKHWKTIEQNYSKSPFFPEFCNLFKDLYLQDQDTYLSSVNLKFIKAICKVLEIDTLISTSKDYTVAEDRVERLINICKQADAEIYCSGPSAKSYLDIERFNREGIEVNFFDFNHFPHYPQRFDQKSLTVSVLDLIFNIGNKSKNFLGLSPRVKGV